MDWTQIAAPAVNFGGGILQAGINSRTAKALNRNTIIANKQMAEYAWNKDVEMWKMNNAYNSPEQQMQRLTNAGLNPNLVYGNGVTGNSSGQVPTYNPPSIKHDYEPPQFAAAAAAGINSYFDARLRQAQINNVEAQTQGQLINNMIDASTAEWVQDDYYKMGRHIQWTNKTEMGKYQSFREKADWLKADLMQMIQRQIYETMGLSQAEADLANTKLSNTRLAQLIRLEPYKTFGGMASKAGTALAAIFGARGLGKIAAMKKTAQTVKAKRK